MKITPRVFSLLFCLAGAVGFSSAAESSADAPLRLNSLFQDNAVLQRGVPMPVWGTARDGEKITVKFAGQTATTVATNGTWKATLEPMPANAAPQTMTVEGDTTCTIKNILVGDVWVAGGQSNMERSLGPRPPQKDIVGWKEAVAAANDPEIRQFFVPEHLASSIAADADGRWTVCSPETAPDFSAVGFFFARAIHQAAKVPIGLLFSAWGGTPAEAWTSEEALKAMPDFRDDLKTVHDPTMAQKRYEEGRVNWFHDRDPGSGDGNYSASATPVTGDWKPVTLPITFGGAFDGVVWFRKEIELPESWSGKPAVLHLGAIDDEDTTWVNGSRIGATDNWQAPRNYEIPAGVLKSGRNVIAIRTRNNPWSPGGFKGGPEQLKLEVPGDSAIAPIPLAGEWLSCVGVPIQKATGFPINPHNNQNAPTVLYNAMLAPLQSFPIKGVIWYQGEANNGRARQYRELLPLMIADWRRGWGLGDFPFLLVQIAPFRGTQPDLREAQLLTLQKAPRTAMVVTADIGDAEDIHPARKAPVGERLALAARALAYGEKIEYSGPLFEAMKIDGRRAALSFTHTGGGMVAKGGELKGFTIAAANKTFVPAKAEIKGNEVVVWSDEVASPVAVRYGWTEVPEASLFNDAGLPASPFRTDVD